MTVLAYTQGAESQQHDDSLTVNAEISPNVAKSQTSDTLKSSMGVDLGIGPAHGLYGIGLTWDTRTVGISLHTGIYNFPENTSFTLKHNRYIEDAAVIFSPSISFGYRNGSMILTSPNKGCFWGSGNLCFTNFVNKHLYLQNQIGVGYSTERSIIVNYGICAGYQFGGTLFGSESYRRNLGFKIFSFTLSSAVTTLIGFIDQLVFFMIVD